MSHGSLLIRSPATGARKTNVDIVAVGVKYLSGPTLLGRCDLAEPSEHERATVNRLFGPDPAHCVLWVLGSEHGRLLIAGAFLNVSENEHGPFSSPFDL